MDRSHEACNLRSGTIGIKVSILRPEVILPDSITYKDMSKKVEVKEIKEEIKEEKKEAVKEEVKETPKEAKPKREKKTEKTEEVKENGSA